MGNTIKNYRKKKRQMKKEYMKEIQSTVNKYIINKMLNDDAKKK